MKLTLTTLTLLVTLAVHSQTYSLLMTNSSGVASNSITVPTPTATFISPTGQALTNTFSINTTSLIDQMAQDATNRAIAASTGADFARAEQIYTDNYDNDGFWQNFWTGNASSSTWLDEIRVLDVDSSNAVTHLQGTLNWFSSITEFPTLDGKPLNITYTTAFAWRGGTTYTFNAVINGTTITTSGSFELAWQQLKTQLYSAWVAQASVIDTNGAKLAQDFTIINSASPNASTYELTESGLHAPDSSILSLLVDSATAANNIANMTNLVSITSDVTPPTNADFNQVFSIMVASGAVIPPAAVTAPSDAVTGIRAIYNNSATDPVTLRQQLLALLYNDLMQGSWSNGRMIFARPMQHSAAFMAVWNSYAASCNQLIAYYQSILTQLNKQIADANAMDQTIQNQVATYQNEANQQAPAGSAINTSQATQLFNQQVQPGSTSFPLIGEASYLIWLLGPPWAETTGWQVGPYWVPNPLYYTIVAQYVRGLVDDAGISIQPQNVAENALKAGTQQNMAINDIVDLADKQSQEQSVNGMYATYGQQSQHVNSTAVTGTVSTMQTYTNTFDPTVGATMSGVNASRAASQQLAQQQQQTFTQINSDQTLLQRAAIKNQQELTKTATMQALSQTINNRTTAKAIGRMQDLQTTNNEQELDRSLGQGGLQ